MTKKSIVSNVKNFVEEHGSKNIKTSVIIGLDAEDGELSGQSVVLIGESLVLLGMLTKIKTIVDQSIISIEKSIGTKSIDENNIVKSKIDNTKLEKSVSKLDTIRRKLVAILKEMQKASEEDNIMELSRLKSEVEILRNEFEKEMDQDPEFQKDVENEIKDFKINPPELPEELKDFLKNLKDELPGSDGDDEEFNPDLIKE